MTVMLLTEHNLEFVSLKGGCTGSRESTHVNMAHCWKSHVVAHVALRTARLHGWSCGLSESSWVKID